MPFGFESSYWRIMDFQIFSSNLNSISFEWVAYEMRHTLSLSWLVIKTFLNLLYFTKCTSTSSNSITLLDNFIKLGYYKTNLVEYMYLGLLQHLSIEATEACWTWIARGFPVKLKHQV